MGAGEAVIGQAADRLWEAERTLVPCAPIRDVIDAQDIESAYAIQQVNVDRHVAAGRRISGRKIGISALSVQQQLGVDQPDFGALFADMEYGHGSIIPVERTIKPRVEAEIALVLGADLDQQEPTIADVVRATAFVIPSLEIVDCRLANWDIRIADTIADNAAACLYVLGSTPQALLGLDLAGAAMTLHRNGEVVATGHGSDTLGHPLNATVWLARTLTGMGTPLRAGDTILTGALGPMVDANPGDVFEATIEGLGTVTATFGQA